MNSRQRATLLSSEEAAHYLSRSCIPIGLAYSGNSTPLDPIKRATGALVRLGERDVMITCGHVHSELLAMRKVHADARMVGFYLDVANAVVVQLHGYRFLDLDLKSLDVAIYGGSENEIVLPGLRFIDYAASYLSDPQPGEAVAIVGYPAHNISVVPQKADFAYSYMVLTVSSVSERQIKMANETGSRVFTHYDQPELAGIPLGGLSGSPAFIIRDRIPRFVGIVTDCSNYGQVVDSTIIVSRLGCLNGDGTLDHTAIAW